MKKILTLLFGVLIFPVSSSSTEVEFFSDASLNNSERLPNNLILDYPFTGVHTIVVDDGYQWTYAFAESLTQINSDLGLTGTPWEMSFTVAINPRGGNGIIDWDGSSPSQNPSNPKLTLSELRRMAGLSCVEIALHGYTENVIDPIANDTGIEVDAMRGDANYDDVESIFKRGVMALEDSALAGFSYNIESHVMNGHKSTPVGRYYAAKSGIKHLRGGLRRYKPSTSVGSNLWHTSSNTSGSDNFVRGTVKVHHRQNIDPISYWWSNYGSMSVDLYSPMFPTYNLDLLHTVPATGAATSLPSIWGETNTTDALRRTDFDNLIKYLADQKSWSILTLHNINADDGQAFADNSADPDSGLYALIDIYENQIGPLAQNGLNGSSPSLMAASLDKATKMRNAMANADRPIPLFDNPWLLEGQMDDGVPFGHPVYASNWWSDSSWTYQDSTQAAAAGGWFGVENNGGVFGLDVSAAGITSLVTVAPVRGSAILEVSCMAAADTLGNDSNDPTNGYVAEEYIDIIVDFYRYNFDPSDTTVTFGVGGVADGPEELIVDPGTRRTSTDWKMPTGDVFSNGAMVTNRFHSNDGWDTIRNSGWTNVWWQGEGLVTEDKSQRWATFNKVVRVPHDANWVKIQFRPMNFDAADTDSIAIGSIIALQTPY